MTPVPFFVGAVFVHRESIPHVFHNFGSMSAAVCSVVFCSSTDILGKPGICVAVCRDQRHWAARISHKVPCKFVLSCSRRTHRHCSPWLLGVTSLYSSGHISYKSGTGIQGKPDADFHVLYDQTQTVANLSSILCIAARLPRSSCMQCTCTPRLQSVGLVSISQCSFAHTKCMLDVGILCKLGSVSSVHCDRKHALVIVSGICPDIYV